MPAVPARPLLTIRHDATFARGVAVELTDRDGETSTVSLDTLSRSELCRVIHRIGSSPKRDGIWKSNAEMLDEVASGDGRS